MFLQLTRLSDNGVQTTGKLLVKSSEGLKVAEFDTLELSYKGNQRRISCIPNGTYSVFPRFSFRHGTCFEIGNVPERDAILIHKGNFNSQTKGCVLIGHGFKDVNNDFELDVLNSKIAMEQLLVLLKAPTSIIITTQFLNYELK